SLPGTTSWTAIGRPGLSSEDVAETDVRLRAAATPSTAESMGPLLYGASHGGTPSPTVTSQRVRRPPRRPAPGGPLHGDLGLPLRGHGGGREDGLTDAPERHGRVHAERHRPPLPHAVGRTGRAAGTAHGGVPRAHRPGRGRPRGHVLLLLRDRPHAAGGRRPARAR